MAQFARPDSNIVQTGFTGGFADIDEASPSDADFACGANNTAAELEVGLSNVTDPAVSTGHIFRYRIAKVNACTVNGGGNAVTVTARLLQGSTEIAADTAKTATDTWTQYERTLSGAEADAITDYTDLRLEFVTSASGGSPANRRGGAVSWAELEVPDASADRRGQVTWAEFELPNAPRRGQVTWTELEVPNVPVADRSGWITWAELEAPNAPRRGRVSWTEIEIPETQRGRIFWAEVEAPLAPRSGIVSWAELEIPSVGGYVGMRKMIVVTEIPGIIAPKG